MMSNRSREGVAGVPLVIVLGFCTALMGASSEQSAPDWPRFQGADSTAVVENANVARTWPAGGPGVLWTVDVGEGFGGAAIADGRVYLLDRVGTEQDKLRVLDLKSGNEVWSYAYAAPGKLSHHGSRSTPTVDGERVYTVGPFGHLHCIDLKTRKPVWRKHLVDDLGGIQPRWGFSQSALVHGRLVIVSPRGREHGVVALDKQSGEVVWRSKRIGDAEAYASPIAATLAGVEQVVVLHKGALAGLDPATGEVLWQYDGYPCKRPIPSPTIVDEHHVFVTGGYKGGCAMVRIDRKDDGLTVTEVFKDQRNESKIPSALVYKGHIYTNSDDNRSGLQCMTPGGKILWQTERKPGFDMGGMIIADGLIFIMDGQSGELSLVEARPDGFNRLASAKVLEGKGGRVWGPLAIADGKLIVRDQNQMKCLDVSGK